MLDTVRQDVRYALRTIRRNPGFAAVAVLTLALGIGANSAIFSVVDGVLLRPLPYAQPDRLVRVLQIAPDEGVTVTAGSFSPQDFEDLERDNGVYERLAAYYFIPGQSAMNLVGGGEPRQVSTAFVSAGFFPTLGVPAARGRPLRPEENVPGTDRVVVLSHGFWRGRFGSDPGVVGRTVSLNDQPFTVVGVMPPSFQLPSPAAEIWVPISLIGDNSIPHVRGLRWMNVIGRLEPGATVETAAAATNTVLKRLERRYPESNEGWGSARVITLKESLVGDVRPALLVLFGAVALVLLIACANLANLLLARGSTRGREIAIRTALGAGGGRVVRQLLTESITLALVGGFVGLILAIWGVDALVLLSAGTIPRPDAIRLDAGVIGFTLLASLITGVIFGLIPALKASRADLHDALKEGGRGGTEGRQRQGTRWALVAAEMALAVVLLTAAGLTIRSFWNLTRVDPGFTSENILALGIRIQSTEYAGAEQVNAYRRELIERIENLPGVLAVGGSETMPLEGGGEPYAFSIPGRTDQSSIAPRSGTYIVTPGYFRALGIPFVGGRTFRETADRDPPWELIINEAMARRYWAGEDPVGQVMRIGDIDLRIVGVVGDVRNDDIAEAPAPAVYVSASVFRRSSLKLFVRTASDPLRFAGAVRQAIWDVNPDQPIADVATMREVVSRTVARPRFLTLLLAAFGGLALVLAALGIYGVLAYVVSQRTHEIGIRIALGADRGSILRLIVGRAMGLALGGLAVGLLCAFAVTRLMASLLYGVSAADPGTFVAVALALAAVALLASYLPARAAIRVDPITALRAE